MVSTSPEPIPLAVTAARKKPPLKCSASASVMVVPVTRATKAPVLPVSVKVAPEAVADIVGPSLSERMVMVPLVVLIVFLGVYPKPVLDRIGPSVRDLITHVQDNTDYQQPAVAAGSGDE